MSRFPGQSLTRVPPVLCSVSFHDPEGYIDSTDYPPLPLHSYLECTYNVTVYTGYGVELQVRSASVGGSPWSTRPYYGNKGCKAPASWPWLPRVPVLAKNAPS